MKNKKIMRMFALMMAATMTMSMFSGCGNAGQSANEGSVAAEVPVQSGIVSDTMDAQTLAAGGELLSFIKTNFAASGLEEDYNKPLYDLPKDHTFEFECSEAAGYVAYKAFKVFDNSDYEDITGMVYNRNVYENGKIKVVPDGTLALNENGSYNTNDGTWGSLNQLYLVQYVDLNTGEDLEKPLVTPFTIQHDLAAPSVSQSLDENNSYVLSWEAVPGAVEYRVYEHFGDCAYKLECTTTDTSVSVEDFATQKKSENYMELLHQDLGYEQDGIAYMNTAAKFDDTMKDGYFVVVAVDAMGKQSGISKIMDVRELANRLPYTIPDRVIDVEITSVEDIPAYVDVEMADGSIQKMVIDFHGAQAYYYPDDEMMMSIRAKVANTLFNNFVLRLHGMKYEDVLANISVVTERQDDLLSKVGGMEQGEVVVKEVPAEDVPELEVPEPSAAPTIEPSVAPTIEPTAAPTAAPSVEPSVEPSAAPTVEPTVAPTAEPSVEPTVEPTAAPSVEPSVEPSATPSVETPQESGNDNVQLMNEVAVVVQQTLNEIGMDHVNATLYASSDLQAWLAMCLIAQAEVIPVPVEVFPEAANVDYLFTLLYEAHRQNPTSGLYCEAKYAYEYETLLVTYVEEPTVRLNKTKQEFEAAKRIAAEVTHEGMSDYEKVLAINEYFRINASYDFDSMSTNVEDFSTLSEQFMDSHSPYGIICKNYGVCESYSEAFCLTARYAGLEVMNEIGALYGGGHEWNRVKVDGSWCVLDVTNNDTDFIINGLFNVTDAQVAGVLVPDNSAIMNQGNYVANDATKEYYYMSGKCATDMSQAADLIAAQLQTQDTAFVRIPKNTSDAQIEAALSDLVNVKGTMWSTAGKDLDILFVKK